MRTVEGMVQRPQTVVDQLAHELFGAIEGAPLNVANQVRDRIVDGYRCVDYCLQIAVGNECSAFAQHCQCIRDAGIDAAFGAESQIRDKYSARTVSKFRFIQRECAGSTCQLTGIFPSGRAEL
jgi:hypothetical protein